MFVCVPRFLAICTQINIRAHSTAIKARIAVICVWIIAAIASIPSYVLVVSTVRVCPCSVNGAGMSL